MILAIDVGKGTEDALVYEKGNIENSIQMVFPSMAQLVFQLLEREDAEIIMIRGDTMAGEPWNKLIYAYAGSRRVIMTVSAARSLRYNLEEVRAKNIEIVNDDDFTQLLNNHTDTEIPNNLRVQITKNIALYSLSDVNWPRIRSMLLANLIDINTINTILLCCQDHGEPRDKGSVRDFRIHNIYSGITRRGKVEDLMQSMENIPDSFPRHRNITKTALSEFDHLNSDNIFLMDSSPAVLLGTLLEIKRNKIKDQIITINAGNGHTVVSYIDNNMVLLVYETHTGHIATVFEDLRKIITGGISHQDILKAGGHGVYIHPEFRSLEPELADKILAETVYIIGPNRGLIEHHNIEYLHPGGSMMMAGPIGLIAAFNHQS